METLSGVSRAYFVNLYSLTPMDTFEPPVSVLVEESGRNKQTKKKLTQGLTETYAKDSPSFAR